MSRCVVFTFVPILLCFSLSCNRQKNELVSREPLTFDAERLFELSVFGEQSLEGRFSSPLAVVLYFNELSCSTCTSRTLLDMARFEQIYGDCADFILVVRGQDPVYLSNLRRLGRVTYPILLEQAGELAWPDTMLAVLDKTGAQIVAHCLPNPDESVATPMIADFEVALREQIAKFSCESTDVGSNP